MDCIEKLGVSLDDQDFPNHLLRYLWLTDSNFLLFPKNETRNENSSQSMLEVRDGPRKKNGLSYWTSSRAHGIAMKKIKKKTPRKSKQEQPKSILSSIEDIPLSIGRKKVYLEFSPDSKSLQIYGKLILVLFFDIAPKTCQVFMEFISKCSRKNPIAIDRIFQNRYMEFMIVDPSFKKRLDQERNDLKHDHVGILSAMYVDSKFRRRSYLSFTITFSPHPELDGKRQVFGQVVKGADLLLYIETLGTKRGWKREDLFLSKGGIDNSKKIK